MFRARALLVTEFYLCNSSWIKAKYTIYVDYIFGALNKIITHKA